MKSPKPYSVGQIVMYVPFPSDYIAFVGNVAPILPAVIVATWAHTSYEHSEVNLKVFTDGQSDWWRTSVPYSSDKVPGTWHWPEIK